MPTKRFKARRDKGMHLSIAEWKYAFHALTGRCMNPHATDYREVEELYKTHGEAAIRAALKGFDVDTYVKNGYPHLNAK